MLTKPRALPLELCSEISKRLPVPDLKNLRLSSHLLYIASTYHLYDKCNITIFLNSARNGCLETLIKIYNYSNNNDLIKHQTLDDQKYTPFELASMNGHLNIIKQLFDWFSDEEKVTMIEFDDYRAFRLASKNGHLNIIKQIYDWVQSDEKKMDMILESGFLTPFTVASENGHLNIIKQLYDWVKSDEEKVAIIAFGTYLPFRLAAENRHLNITNQILIWSSEEEGKSMKNAAELLEAVFPIECVMRFVVKSKWNGNVEEF